MATVLLDMVISLDGLICGPGGADGGLHDWYVDPSEVSRPVPAPQGAGRGPGSSTLRTSHICTTASTVSGMRRTASQRHGCVPSHRSWMLTVRAISSPLGAGRGSTTNLGPPGLCIREDVA